MTPQVSPSRTKQLAVKAVVLLLLAACGATGTVLVMQSRQTDPDSQDPALANETPHSQQKTPQPAGATLSPDDAGTATLSGDLLAGLPESVLENPSSSTQTLANHIAIGDEELRVGNLARALRIYQLAAEEDKATAPIRFRIGLCAEASGHFREALTEYLGIRQSFPESPWTHVALTGAARCMLKLGRTDTFEESIFGDVLLNGPRFSPAIRSELLHLCGFSVCHETLKSHRLHLLNDDGLVLATRETDPNVVLDSLPTVLVEPPPVSTANRIAILQKINESPETVFLRVESERLSVRVLIQTVSVKSGFEAQFSESAAVAISGRMQQLNVPDMSLALVLDGLTLPYGLVWIATGQTLHFHTREELQEDHRLWTRAQAADRMLQFALLDASDSPYANQTRLALGVMQFLDGKVSEAARTFSVSLDQDKSPVESEAAFNLGKCLMQLADYPGARKAFLTNLDSFGALPETRLASYLYFGRLQLENDEYQPAVSTLVRALALAEDTYFEAETALQLAGAYLASGNPQGANSVLMKRRKLFRTSSQRSAAAFLSAFARYKAAVLSERRFREGRSLVSALSQFQPKNQFGVHWLLLASEAYDSLGLTDQSIEASLAILERLSAGQLRDRILLRVAQQYRYDQRFDESAMLLSMVSAGDSEDISGHVSIQAAMVALQQGDSEKAVQLCRHVVSSSADSTLRRTALQTMGKAFELKNDHRSAVYCFAGMLPEKHMMSSESPGGQ